MRAGMNMGLGTLLASTNPFAYVLSTLRSAGVSIVNQLLADQWAYQQRALALYPGQPAKCVLFQDAAGTTPVTAVEQPIGLALDLETAGTWDGVTAISSLPGTHMRQSTTSKRAMLSARVNFLERTQEFDNAYWTKTACTITPNATAAPDGTLTAGRLIPNAGTNLVARVARAWTWVSGQSNVLRFSAKAGEIRYMRVIASGATGSTVEAYFDLQAGISGNAAGCTAAIESQPNGFYACSISFAATVSGAGFVYAQAVAAMGTSAYTGSGVDGLFIWGADLRLSVDVHPSIPAYQRVTAATDYATVGFPVYKRFDGVDDAYASAASLNLTGTDEVTVFAPITKESDAAAGVVLESSGISSVVAGSFGFFPALSPGSYNWRIGGSLPGAGSVNPVGFPAPRKSLLTGIGKISTDTAIIRVNGVQAATSAGNQGTGNYGNHTLFEGARDQTSLYFKGESQGFLILGKNLTSSQLAIVERYINNLWKAY